MRRALAGLVGFYVLAAVSTRLAERLGLRRCGCAEDCWCRKPALSAFRWVFPRGHRIDWAGDREPPPDPPSPTQHR